ncbi:hypothetical protein [Nostoc sp. CHAB 5715]|uniref:hypothetical protein n=1 Tax=Nostoc sp. CHAB 5715 TaxID=2780400 RepID=UPI001E452114|nr:hypothetical protein [Nostoc sp. CHAB 5715]MCC5623235.1 hypothetical protein [Nostoc sp. CHAB 5715]
MLTINMRDRVSLETVSVSLPFGIGSMVWKVDTTQRKAAWSLYCKLVLSVLP